MQIPEFNIGKTVSYETYQLDVERAEKAPAARNDILAKRFGLPMEGYTYYFTYEETLPHRKRSYWQMACSLGADLSQGDDFCAFTFLFPLSNGAFGIKTRNYITSSKVVYGQPQYNQIIIHDTSWNSLETAKAYLAAQKAAGTPVQIAYQLATPEVYATDPVDFDNAAGPLTVLTGGELEAAFKSADKVVESRIDFVEDTLNEQGQAIAEKAPISHSSDKSTYGLGSGSQFGHVKLSDATASGSNAGQGIAATPSAVNQVNARVSTVDGIARAAMPKSGGTFTGNVLASSVNEAGAFLRNISVQNSASQSQYTNFIIMVRK